MPDAVQPPDPAQLAAHARIAVFLDLDGTLIELAPRPDLVVVSAELPELLNAVSHRLQGALAIVSGRSIASIDELLAPYQGAAAGLHGAQLRPSPVDAVVETTLSTPPQHVLEHVAVLRARSREFLIEDKGACVAVHHRLAGPALEALRESLRSALATHAPDLDLLEGRNVLEVKPRAVNKGAACRRLMSETAFAGRRPVVFGDDITDIDAFGFAAEAHGIAVAVGKRVTTHAPARLPGPADVLAWLRGLLG